MVLVRSVLAIALGAVYVLSAIVVAVGAFLENRRLVLRNEDRHVSATPIVGSIAGTLAVLIAPVGALRDRAVWLWVPFAVEAALYGLLVVLWSSTGLQARSERQRQQRREPPR